MKYLKPKIGEPCNNCGMCCISSLCPVAIIIKHGVAKARETPEMPGPCPFLTPAPDGKLLCGVRLDPAKHAPLHTAAYGAEQVSAAMGFMQGMGNGCDAEDERDGLFSIMMHRLEAQARFYEVPRIFAQKHLNVWLKPIEDAP